jgi:hypothetical protein
MKNHCLREYKNIYPPTTRWFSRTALKRQTRTGPWWPERPATDRGQSVPPQTVARASRHRPWPERPAPEIPASRHRRVTTATWRKPPITERFIATIPVTAVTGIVAPSGGGRMIHDAGLAAKPPASRSLELTKYWDDRPNILLTARSAGGRARDGGRLTGGRSIAGRPPMAGSCHRAKIRRGGRKISQNSAWRGGVAGYPRGGERMSP